MELKWKSKTEMYNKSKEVVWVYNLPSSNAGQGSQCRPIGFSRYVGPSAIPKKFPAILGTESHGRNSQEHNYPHSHDYIAG